MNHSLTNLSTICPSLSRLLMWHDSFLWCDMTHSCDATRLIQTLCRIVCESCRIVCESCRIVCESCLIVCESCLIVNDATQLIPVIKLGSFTQCDMTQRNTLLTYATVKNDFAIMLLPQFGDLCCDMTQQDPFTFSTYDTVKNDFVCMLLPQFGGFCRDMTHSHETTRLIHSVRHDSTCRIHIIHICYRKKLSRLHGDERPK